MKVVRIRVPATTANLGPGFDCLGIALRIFNTVSVWRERVSGKEAIAEEAAEAFFRAAKTKPFEFGWKITGEVPRSRGLGSSVTVRLGILHGLNELAGGPLGREALFELCAELEGHPDNAAPAAFGGFTVARAGAPVLRHAVGRNLKLVLLIPDFEVATPAARRVLPKAVSLHDAVVSLGNASAIAAAFASRDYEKLAGCFEDRLHQPYREKLVPFLPRAIAAGVKAGALGGWLSGSGSTIACVTLGNAEAVTEAMRKASGLRGAGVTVAAADNAGARIF